MNTAFSFEEVPFEFDSEFAQEEETEIDPEKFESQLSDSEGEEEIRRGAPFSPRGTSGYRQPGRPPRPMPNRPWPSKHPLRGYSPPGRPLFVDYRDEGEPASCTCPVHGTEFVRWVQSALNNVLGLRLAVDGIRNAATRSALRRFQEQQSLPVDGIAGPETKEALVREGAGNPHLLRQLRTGQRILKVTINPSPWSLLQHTLQSQLNRSPCHRLRNSTSSGRPWTP